MASAFGLVTGGSEKGYRYSEEEPSPLVESLDRIPIKVESNKPVYKKMKGNWYLYYSWDD